MAAIVSSPSAPSAQPDDVKTKAHHNKHGKGFLNPWDSYTERGGLEIFRKIVWMRLTGAWKDPDTTPPTVPVQTPSFLPTRGTKNLRATWLGHACYFVEFPSGFRVLFDPVFEERCSPYSFLGPKRYTPVPCKLEDIPIIDAVVISHSHYDHMSHPTLTALATKHPNLHFFVPLGNKPWMTKNIPSAQVSELDWWDEKEMTISNPNDKSEIKAVIGSLPCQHTSARTVWDKGHTLWSSWSVTSGGKKVWFGGDTGYRTVPQLPKDEFDYGDKYSNLPHCPAFKQIGDLRGPFDLGLIPIGAYDPRWIMSPMHANPYDSVNIFLDTKCEKAMGIHWGTWVLTSEEVLEPPKLLKKALEWKGVEAGRFATCDLGESREF